MEGKLNIALSTLLMIDLSLVTRCVGGMTCQGLSADVTCECDCYGRCKKGTVAVDPWLQQALKTQRELQIDIPLDQTQIFDAHNAFNNRAYGPVYGANDTCHWPPPYKDPCMGLANHEFSIIDMFNMGVRAVAIDIWWCNDAMRVAHLGTPLALGCGEFNILFDDVIGDIGDWLDQPGNGGEFIRIAIDEKYPQGHDDEVNEALEQHLGHSRILSPADFVDMYGGMWPTLRQMRQDGKLVLVVSSEDTTHEGKYIHVKQCDGEKAKKFTNYPQCGGKTGTNCKRFRGDATHYVSDAIYDGPTSSGAILDLSEMVKCRINLPATDMVTPQLMETAVYTWAKEEPSLELHEHVCVLLSHRDYRWYTSSDCSQSLSYACQSLSDPDAWTISEATGPYDVTRDLCPIGHKFSVPHNGYKQQKLKEAMNGRSVWINYTPYITGRFPPTMASLTTQTVGSGSDKMMTKWTFIFTIISTGRIFREHLRRYVDISSTSL